MPDLEILQGIILVEDIRELFRNKTLNTKKAHSFLSEKSYKNVLRVSFIYWKTLILNGHELLFRLN